MPIGDQVVRSLLDISDEEYNKMVGYCISNKISVLTYLEKLGKIIDMKLIPAIKNKGAISVIERMLGLYPDRKVTALSKRSRSLNTLVHRYKNRAGASSIEEYLGYLGFKFIRNSYPKKPTDKQYILNYLKNKLTELYPDGKVVYLRKNRPYLYEKVRAQMYRFGFDNVDGFLKSLGFELVDSRKLCRTEAFSNKLRDSWSARFEYVDGVKIYKKHRERLLKIYPDKVVRDIMTNHPTLYNTIRHFVENGSRENTYKYIELMGFKVDNSKSCLLANSANLKKVAASLSKVYPDKRINQKDFVFTKEYYKIRRYMRDSGRGTIEEFMEAFEFDYYIEGKPGVLKYKILREIEKLFPNRIITRPLKSLGLKFYNGIYVQAHRLGMKTREFLEINGFKYTVSQAETGRPKEHVDIIKLKVMERESSIMTYLAKNFPDGIININTSTCEEHNNMLYVSKYRGLTVKKYLASLGYTISKPYKRRKGNESKKST